mmetsp:Transcript_9492/g.17898  ORF Transcript_9492/g.17898 Transcript_9492/m.17898 type:complete len:817 (+) Transcript_9492:1065-3515(+)
METNTLHAIYQGVMALVGRRVQVGTFLGTITSYNVDQDSFDCAFDVGGDRFPVPRSNIAGVLLPHSTPQHQTATVVGLLPQQQGRNEHEWGQQAQAQDAGAQNYGIQQPKYHGHPFDQQQAFGFDSVPHETPVKPALPSHQDPLNLDERTPKQENRVQGQENQLLSANFNRPNTSLVSKNTKTQVFKMMHACYKRDNERAVRQDAFYRGNVIPKYEAIEAAMETPTNVNAGRISTLRSRHLMMKTLSEVADFLPWSAMCYIVNCITSACPLCGRSIALNKLASYENWCKHLDLHGTLGNQISDRFRALDKNQPFLPSINRELAATATWAHVDLRADTAPYDDSIYLTGTSLVPFTSHFHWQSVMFAQLIQENAVVPSSVLCQELVVFGLTYLGVPFSKDRHFYALEDFQRRIQSISSSAFNEYIGVPDHTGSPLTGRHISIIQDGSSTQADYSVDPKPVSEPSILFETSLFGDGFGTGSPDTSSRMHGIFDDVTKQWYNKGEYLAEDVPTFEQLEGMFHSRTDKVQIINILRIITLHQREVVGQTFAELVNSNDVGQFYVLNAFISVCPVCGTCFRCSSLALDNDTWLEHLEGGCRSSIAAEHQNLARQAATRYKELAANKVHRATPCVSLASFQEGDAQLCPPPMARVDIAPMNTKIPSTSLGGVGVIPLTNRLNWRALLLDILLVDEKLRSTSILTQEIVVMGLFYFGLVNQRSPQKFGQYPQLQSFQRDLHRHSHAAYDIYCGIGIKEGDIGSSHTRGKPVSVTQSVIHKYNHYGLSHKSLKRTAGKALGVQDAKKKRKKKKKKTRVLQPDIL